MARHWVAVAAVMALGLLLLFPVIAARDVLPVQLIYLYSPAYMAHQVEEHSRDRFRRFVNNRVFAGTDAITRRAVFFINVPGVWGINPVALVAAMVLAPGYALVAGYAMLINALTHIGMAVRLRDYNPGLFTAVTLFLPLGLAVIMTVGALPSTSAREHIVAFGLALLLHLLIAAHVLRRVAAVRRLVVGRA